MTCKTNEKICNTIANTVFSSSSFRESKPQVKVCLICLSCWLLADVVLVSAIQFACDCNELVPGNRKVEILGQINIKTTLFCYNWNERVWKHDRMVTDPNCSDTRKGEKTQANRNLNWAKHHLPKSGILIVEPGRKKSLNWSRKKRLLLNARLAVCQLHPWNQTIFAPFRWLKRPTWQ